MLGKLMKYDLRSCLRKFGPLWLATLALSVVTGLFFRFANKAQSNSVLMGILTALLPTALVILIVTIGVLTLVFVCERFYKGLLGDEGYLMHTLPATAGAHIASKGLTALILELVSGLVGLLSAFLIVLTFQPEELARGWQDFLTMLRSFDFPAATPWLIIELFLVGVVVTATETLKIYAAISLGHLAKRRRVLWAILAYIGIDVVINSLFGAGVSSGLLAKLFVRASWDTFEQFCSSGLGVAAGLMGSAILWELLLGAAFFFLSRYILKKHLNLE